MGELISILETIATTTTTDDNNKDELKTKCFELLNQKAKANELIKKGDLKAAEQLLVELDQSVLNLPNQSSYGWSQVPKIYVELLRMRGMLKSNLSFVYTQQHKFTEARDTATETIRLCPKWIKGYLRMAEACVAQMSQETLESVRLDCLRTITGSLSKGISLVDGTDFWTVLPLPTGLCDLERAKELLQKYTKLLHTMNLDKDSKSTASPSVPLQAFQDWMTKENPNGVRGLEIQEHTPTNRCVISNKTLYDQSIVLTIPVCLFFYSLKEWYRKK